MGLGYRDLKVSQHASGTLLNTFTVAKTVINPQALYVIPAGILQVGSSLHIEVAGAISNIITTPGTITFQCMIGANIAFTTGAIQLNAAAHTTLPFLLTIDLTLQAEGNGTTGKFMGQGKIEGIMPTVTAGQVDGVNSMTVLLVPATAPAQGAGFDTTTAQVLDFFAGFSISGAGNGVQIHQYKIFSDNF